MFLLLIERVKEYVMWLFETILDISIFNGFFGTCMNQENRKEIKSNISSYYGYSCIVI